MDQLKKELGMHTRNSFLLSLSLVSTLSNSPENLEVPNIFILQERRDHSGTQRPCRPLLHLLCIEMQEVFDVFKTKATSRRLLTYDIMQSAASVRTPSTWLSKGSLVSARAVIYSVVSPAKDNSLSRTPIARTQPLSSSKYYCYDLVLYLTTYQSPHCKVGGREQSPCIYCLRS